MGATLTGVPLYAAHGYEERDRTEVPLGNGVTLPIVRMEKTIYLCSETDFSARSPRMGSL